MSQPGRSSNHSGGPTGDPIYDAVLELRDIGYTQEEIGKRLGYSRQWISQLLRQADEWLYAKQRVGTEFFQLADPGPGPEAQMAQAEFVQAFLEELDPWDEKIVMFLTMGYRQIEIAAKMHMSRQRVSQRVARVREQMRQFLKDF